MPRKPRFDLSFDFGANVKPKAKTKKRKGRKGKGNPGGS